MSIHSGTISGFLQASDFQYRVFDLGRRVVRLSNLKFERMEKQEKPYPWPLQQQAWMGIIFWQHQRKHEPIIWFLRFPLDEMGCIQLATRDRFLHQLIEHVGDNVKTQLDGDALNDKLKESPLAFKPKEVRLAAFHAQVTVLLAQEPSRFYRHTRDYLSGKLGYDQWSFVGLQGLADIAVRLHEDNNEALICKALCKLPDEPLRNLCFQLENVVPSKQLTALLLQRLQRELNSPQPSGANLAALVRGLSHCGQKLSCQTAYKSILESKHGTNADVLVALSSRAWEEISSKELAPLYLESLAQVGQKAFAIILVDLLAIPGLRQPILQQLRRPERSQLLAERMGTLFSTLTKAANS